MSRFLVTGGAGFIGSHLVDALLAGGHEVDVLDDLSSGKRGNLDPAARLIVGTICDEDTVAEATAAVDGVFHLAAIASVPQCNERWAASHAVNAGGTVTVFEACRKADIPVVYASSAAVYGDPAVQPVDETIPPAPLTAYGADKLANEQHAALGGQIHGLRSAGLRFFNVYGPRQDPKSPYSGVISIFADRLSRGKALTVFGDGLQSRDFIYVGDVVRHLTAAMDKADTAAPVMNVCTGRRCTIIDLAKTMAGTLGLEAVIEHGPARTGDIRHSVGLPDKAAGILGLHAEKTLAEGLRVTLDSLA